MGSRQKDRPMICQDSLMGVGSIEQAGGRAWAVQMKAIHKEKSRSDKVMSNVADFRREDNSVHHNLYSPQATRSSS